jgi:hypothetical protein
MLASPLLVSAQQSSDASSPPEKQPDNQVDEKSWWRGITTDGFLSLSYTYNTNQPEPRLNQFRVFDFNDNDPQLDVAELVIQHASTEPRQFGFTFEPIAGSGVPEVTAAYGLFRNTHTGIAHHFDIPQLFLTYVVPVGKGLRVDAGKFVTHMGYEVIGGYDGYNDNFSRSFIFGYGIPFTHTGVRAIYVFNSKITGTFSLTNGWDDVQRLNHGYSEGFQLAVTTTKTTSVSFNFIHGPERPRDNSDQRSVGEIVAGWKPTARLSFDLDGLYGHEENGVAPGQDAIWKGLAAYSKYNLTRNFSLAFRGEIFGDGGGTRTGSSQTLTGFTLTPEYDMSARFSGLSTSLKKLDGKFAVRGEFRIDQSDEGVFLTSDSFRKQQFTTAVNLIYLF